MCELNSRYREIEEEGITLRLRPNTNFHQELVALGFVPHGEPETTYYTLDETHISTGLLIWTYDANDFQLSVETEYDIDQAFYTDITQANTIRSAMNSLRTKAITERAANAR